MVDSENEQLKNRLSSSGGSRSPPPVSQPAAASSARPPPYSAGNRGQGVSKTILTIIYYHDQHEQEFLCTLGRSHCYCQ
jgi:hypothetical protein